MQPIAEHIRHEASEIWVAISLAGRPYGAPKALDTHDNPDSIQKGVHIRAAGTALRVVPWRYIAGTKAFASSPASGRNTWPKHCMTYNSNLRGRRRRFGYGKSLSPDRRGNPALAHYLAQPVTCDGPGDCHGGSVVGHLPLIMHSPGHRATANVAKSRVCREPSLSPTAASAGAERDRHYGAIHDHPAAVFWD